MKDIDDLIAAAEEEQKLKQDDAAIKKQTRSSAKGRKVSKVPMIVVFLILAVAVINLATLFLPISEDIVRSDLNAALDSAQASIEAYYRENGNLPKGLPAPALKGLVKYEIVDDGYRLSISMNGMTIKREP